MIGSLLVKLFLSVSTLPAGNEAPRFVVTTVDGPLAPAPLLQLEEDWSTRSADGRLVPGSHLVSIESTLPRPTAPDEHFLLLTNGDRLPFEPGAGLRLKEEVLYLQPRFPLQAGAPVGVPLPYCLALWLAAPAKVADSRRFLRQLLDEARPNDVVVLPGGDRLSGTLEGGPDGLRLKIGNDVRKLEKFAVVAFTSELRSKPRRRGPHAQAILAGGARLGFTSLLLDDKKDRLTGKTLFGARLSLPLAELRALDIRQGPTVYLSDLDPKRYEYKPYLGVVWPLGRDENALGGPLHLGGNFYDKGLGLHAGSRVTFALDGKYRWFEAVVGPDEKVGRKARYKIQVLVDDKLQKLVGDGARLQGDEPLRLRLDVRNAKALTLIVESGSYGDVQANVNWANARLIR